MPGGPRFECLQHQDKGRRVRYIQRIYSEKENFMKKVPYVYAGALSVAIAAALGLSAMTQADSPM